jgi:hypothetical protein
LDKAMLPYFPNKISSTAIYLYLGALALVSLLFYQFALNITYIVIGIVWVVGFFTLTTNCTKTWRGYPQKRLIRTLFYTAFGLRVAWVVFSFFFYEAKTGVPFEFEAADSLGYWESGVVMANLKVVDLVSLLFSNRNAISDSGYVFYLALLGKVIGSNIIIVRIIKAALSAWTVVLLYRLAERNIGEEGARMAAVMACFFPNLIYYCGLHLKETEMLFLVVAFLERTDFLIRSRKLSVLNIAVPVLLALSLFTFRTVLGGAAVFSIVSALVFTTTKVIGRRKRIMLISWGLLAVFTLAGGVIVNEIQSTWEERSDNQMTKRQYQTVSGNKWAKYATGAVMAPMIFVLPFPTMVDVANQYNQQMISGGNYVRNFLGAFVLIALFNALFVKKNWRDFALIGSFVVAYLGVISTSGYSNSERFLLPGLPVLLIMAAYGVTQLNAKTYQFVKIWYYVVPIMAVAWAYFKVGSRGLI